MKSFAARFTRKFYTYHKHNGNPLLQRQQLLEVGLLALVPQVCNEISTTDDPSIRRRGIDSLSIILNMLRPRECYQLLLEELSIEKNSVRLRGLLNGFDKYEIPSYMPLDIFLELGVNSNIGVRRNIYSLLARDDRAEAKAFLFSRVSMVKEDVERTWIYEALNVCNATTITGN